MPKHNTVLDLRSPRKGHRLTYKQQAKILETVGNVLVCLGLAIATYFFIFIACACGR